MNIQKVLAFSVGPMGAAILGLITLPIVAWLFSPEDIGRLSMLQLSISFSLLLFSLGLDQAYVREFHEVDDKSALLKAVLWPGLLLLLVALVILALLPWSASGLLFGIDSVVLTSLLLASIVISFCSRFLGLILRMQERGLAYSMSQLLPKFLFLIIILFYVWLGAAAVFQNLMIANVLSLLAVFGIYAWNTRQSWQPACTASIDKAKQRQMIAYAIPLIGSGLAFWGLTAMDKVFLRSLSSFEALGIYAVAFSFAGAALVFQAIFSTVWAPMVYKWAAEGVEPEKIKRVIDDVTLAVMVIWSLAGMLAWALRFVLPPQYEAVPNILLAAMAYPLLYTLSEATGIGIGIQRKTLFTLLATAVALMVNAVGNWLFIPDYGAAGAAIASALAFFVFFILRTEASARLWHSFARTKMYALMSVYLGACIFFNVLDVASAWVALCYAVLLACSLALHQDQCRLFADFCAHTLRRRMER